MEVVQDMDIQQLQAYTTEWAKFLTVNYDFHNVGEIHITFAAVDFSVTTMDGSIYEGAAYPVDSETGLFAYTSVSNTTYIDVENKEVESISISSYHVEQDDPNKLTETRFCWICKQFV